MADESELKELINQAITCAHPHIYGTVNLNRLRDVLCLLVATRKPCDESSKEDRSNQSVGGETESSRDVVPELSQEAGICNSLHSVVSDEEDLNSAVCRSHSLNALEQPAALSLERILMEIEEIGQKVNEINERVAELEVKLPSERCKCSCGVAMEADGSENSSKTETSHAHKISSSQNDPSPDTAADESNVGVDRDGRLNYANDSPPTECEVAPPQASDGNSIQQPASDQSDVSSKTFKNNKPTLPIAVVPVEPHHEGARGRGEDEKSTLPAPTSDSDRNGTATEETRSVVPEFDELVATVHGLVEREQMFFVRLDNIEKLMSSCVDKLFTRLQEERCVPPATVFNDNSSGQDLQPESCTSPCAPESIRRPDGTGTLPETNIRSIIDEFRREICSLKTAFNRLNIAAGGVAGTEIQPRHVQCISCNCAAAMEIHEELIHAPVPFHVRRCMKPMLRRQRDWLQKELKFPAVVPVSMEPYYKLLRKNTRFSHETKS
ncbi:uncharacterized protein LOC118511098 [Anopheles stephensi]|uniref:uncharacterized protein LOC118511098 n=1 Tax=Anopheles stephensi TaxID=30069 RepID=UPI0016589700|nr:uncharacterized protein LOC118511098 [Anopheles stephensi]